MNSLDKEIRKIKNLKQNREKSIEELTSLAKLSLEKSEIISSLTFCINPEERKFASNLLSKYLEESSLEKTAEKDTLRMLIDNSILIERIKKTLNTDYDKANPFIPYQMLDKLTDLNKQNLELKDILKLTTKEEDKNTLGEWEKLKAKALNYYKESAGCNVVRCPECNKLFMILKDMKSCVETKLPWFKKTLLYNRKLFEMYEQNRVSLEEMSIIFGVSSEYIIYINETIYKNEKK